MSYTWITEMRDNDEPVGDGLRGQAAMGWLGGDRVQLTVMSARGTFPAECVISVDDAITLARAILDAARVVR